MSQPRASHACLPAWLTASAAPAAACVLHVDAAASATCASNPCSYDAMVNEYAAMLAPHHRKYFHFFAVLPAIDLIQLSNDEVCGVPPAAWHSHPGLLTSAQCIGSK